MFFGSHLMYTVSMVALGGVWPTVSTVALGGVWPNVVLCKTCSVLLCVLEQPRVDNSSAVSLKRRAQLA